ncbi:ABC transporter ATP-binding protein [Boudabousia marimammalium]|uniref:ABC transporter ATP-binding protein n=1 Tax=Boudabousia marimammalium TaxID=156892 RepID=UPI001FE61F07|nr:ABC transporter ATP-binding protein [Boudabousia marimammalium]
MSLKDFSFQYREQSNPTLCDLNLEVFQGQKVAIVGPSGCGKSTLVSVLNGLIPHHYQGESKGTVKIAGLNPQNAPIVEIARHVGTVLQDMSSQFVGLTVAEDIAFSLENRAVPQAGMPAMVTAAAETVGMESKLDAAPQDLSGGQKQRVAMAGVLVENVDILIFDEPLAMLDPASGRATIDLIDRLNQDGKTILIVEHRLEDVLHRNVDRVILMDQGQIVADLPPNELVATTLLEEHGIRPPLHVAALKYAGIKICPQMCAAYVERLKLSPIEIQKVKAWADSIETTGTTTQVQTETVIELDEVTAAYPPAGDEVPPPVFQAVSVSLQSGSMVAIVGSNGAGKSTLAGAICGFVPITAGVLKINGSLANSWSLAQRGEEVGFVLQSPSQMLSAPLVTDELQLGLKVKGIDAQTIAERCEKALRVCGLWQHRNWPISALSHGQKKRLTIATILALGPSILILDEPTAGQDFAHYAEFMDFLREINQSGVTVVLITHDMHLALEYTQRVLVVSGGEILADDSPAKVLTDPAITKAADLTLTGLHALAQLCGIHNISGFAQKFVEADQKLRRQQGNRGGGA